MDVFNKALKKIGSGLSVLMGGIGMMASNGELAILGSVMATILGSLGLLYSTYKESNSKSYMNIALIQKQEIENNIQQLELEKTKELHKIELEKLKFEFNQLKLNSNNEET